MALLPILTLPNTQLRQRSEEIDPKLIKTPEFQAWLDDLVETMWKADGVGIAAPQVGRPIRVFIAVDGRTPHVVINPVVTGKSWRMEDGEEGCLSVPGKYGVVRRYRAFKIKCLGRDGEKAIHEPTGFFARVLQHELDHLDGVLFIDRAKKITNIQL
jgi:peptide deformylase